MIKVLFPLFISLFVLMLISIPVQGIIVYDEDFEGLSNGNLNGQDSWICTVDHQVGEFGFSGKGTSAIIDSTVNTCYKTGVFDGTQTGSVIGKIMLNGTDSLGKVLILQNTNIQTILRFNNASDQIIADLRCQDGGSAAWFVISQGLKSNVWYNFTIAWNSSTIFTACVNSTCKYDCDRLTVGGALPPSRLDIRVDDDGTSGHRYLDDLIVYSTWEPGIQMSLSSPTNDTFYNNFTMPLIVTNQSFTLDTWWYQLNNNSQNITFTSPSIIYAQSGSNNLQVWGNSTGGTEFSESVYFTNLIKCNSTFEGNTTCGGLNYQNIVRCRQWGVETFQFDNTNMTWCEFGCMDGRCLEQDSSLLCKSRCIQNETLCNQDFYITCNLTADGCWDWNSTGKVKCDFGCFEGRCVPAVNLCNFGERKCSDDGSWLVYCDDDDGDGYREWSFWNKSKCEYRCESVYNLTSDLWNSSCHYHSYTVPERIYSRLQWLGAMLGSPFNSPFLQMAAIFILSIILMIVFGIFTGFKGSIAGFFTGMLFGTLILWMPWYVTFLLVLLGTFMYFKTGEG